MSFTGDGSDPDMVAMFHPCQLEKRFGGAMDTPKNFWPPYVGKEFVPVNTEPPLKQMPEEEYKKALNENPELFWHPDFMTSPDCPSRDFKYTEPYDSTPVEEEVGSDIQSFYSAPSRAPAGSAASHRSRGFMSSMRANSVYLDAYVGDEAIDNETQIMN